MGSRWFVTHLTDLLMRSGQLEALPLKAGGDLREHFMLDYASSLAMAPGLWPVSKLFFFVPVCVIFDLVYEFVSVFDLFV